MASARAIIAGDVSNPVAAMPSRPNASTWEPEPHPKSSTWASGLL